jgi:arylsulfatase A-like enzyme
LRGYKRDLYEGGIRTPMLVRWPGKVAAGSKSNHISAFWDILPTFAEITGAKTPGNIDGISFLPALTGRKQLQHEYLYWEFHEQSGKEAIRMDKWKAVRVNVDKIPQGSIELYDLSKDIGETNNIASSNPEVILKLDAMMKHAHKKSEIFPFSFESITR